MENNKTKRLYGFVMILSIIAVFIITLRYANSFTEYEITEDDTIQTKLALQRTKAKSHDDIPYAESYLLNLENNNVFVYNNSGELIYTEPLSYPEMLSPNDIIELEQHGMFFSDRSQLIEILNYLNSWNPAVIFISRLGSFCENRNSNHEYLIVRPQRALTLQQHKHRLILFWKVKFFC